MFRRSLQSLVTCSRLLLDPALGPPRRPAELHAVFPLRSQLYGPVGSPGAAERHHRVCGRQYGVRELGLARHRPEKPLVSYWPARC